MGCSSRRSCNGRGMSGSGRIITAGSSLESSKAAVRIAEEYPDIYAGVGIHPHAAHLNVTEATFDELRSLAKSSEKVVMICEPGLDYFKSKAPREVQQDVFRQHLRLARDLRPACRVPQPGGLLGLPAHSEGGAGLRGRGHHALLRGRSANRRRVHGHGNLRLLFKDAPQPPPPSTP